MEHTTEIKVSIMNDQMEWSITHYIRYFEIAREEMMEHYGFLIETEARGIIMPVHFAM